MTICINDRPPVIIRPASPPVVIEVIPTPVVVRTTDTPTIIRVPAPSPAPIIQVGQPPLVVLTQVGGVGPPGVPGFGIVVSHTAGQILGGGRVVRLTKLGAFYATNTAFAFTKYPLGITLGAALAGAQVEVQTAGELSDPSWNWTPGARLYLGEDGLLTETTPVAPAYLRVIAVAFDSDTIYIDILQSIILS